ncbi:MAG TPA: flippase activity-associated protein Agl23, partial [Pyrinomonadaceae bacterium]|nr:flippase activity-associated protein Agl23 [Pyrinomonadaceae bacterium]
MPTASTKRGAKRGRAARREETRRAGAPAKGATADERPEPRGGEIPERAWRAGFVAVVAVAALLRFVYLELNPLHHDEGVNGWFLTRLVRDGVYAYDPQNYHGPTLYFITLVPAFLFEKILRVGMSVFMLRAVTSLFGVGIVWMVLSLRRRVGAVGALAAGALLAVSPGAVYQSRYFIHETLFVFFTLGIVLAALRFYETAEGKYLLLAFVSAALLFATKETAFISVGVLALAWGVAWAWGRVPRRINWQRYAGSWRDESGADFPTTVAEAPRSDSLRGASERFGGAEKFGILLLTGAALFVALNVVFYSSFFTNWKGVYGAIETYKFWSKTGMKEVAHAKPLDTYLGWLQQEEAPIYVLAILGAAWAVLRARSRFAVFAGAWGFGLLAAYSLVKYKTPWLSLNFAVPMAVVAGYAVNEAYRWARGRR